MTTPEPPRALVIDSPVGPLRLEADHGALTGIRFDAEIPPPTDRPAPDSDPVLAAAAAQLAEYFEGRRTDFELPLRPSGSPFQLQVWAELCRIGYGETISYGELALRIGRTPAASRAVGLANGANPIPVVVPCHRVIGGNGTLVGYGGGLDRKKVLLRLEAEHAVTAQDRLL
ncbi:methylated-DNA--[protein]-cysteine S-methyltransferase [Microlunatus parietis]|uniref:Methylated-DNA--protein-cysteine methyltransferase n=1 Tax=Microlunatus parietis TaxID=682979 RepID=A0A7Y9I4R5_9ACTN|nr:methylated-DNA--[protein]-cysteine S-methyltransferase [Microlunatus parietis]NYE70252.1 methylated-DNA-[protein]-cysteine S-methyltransferase [Microlunatus parietis]